MGFVDWVGNGDPSADGATRVRIEAVLGIEPGASHTHLFMLLIILLISA